MLTIQTTSAVDPRRWERELAALPVTLALEADKLKPAAFTTTINISLSGVGVRTTLALVPKQVLAIVIRGKFSRTLRARVVWVWVDKSSNLTIAGLKFLHYSD